MIFLTKNLTLSPLLENNFVSFAQASAAICVSQLVLRYLRNNYTTSSMRNLRKLSTHLISTYVPLIFFYNKHRISKKTLKDNPLLNALCVLQILSNLTFSSPFFESIFKKAYLSDNSVYKIDKLVSILLGHESKDNPSDLFLLRIIKSAVRPAVLEEVLFRGVVQELFFRRIPKLILQHKEISPLTVDHIFFKIARVILSTALFVILHIPAHAKKFNWSRGIEIFTIQLFPIYTITLKSLTFSYLTEQVGILPSILAHFNECLYGIFTTQNS